MDSYSYLSVLVSIILGLGVTNILSGFAGLVRERGRVRMYSPVPIWMVTLFLAHVQMWWAMFGLSGVEHWTFAKFLSVLMQPVALYLTSALIVPNFAVEGTLDLREQFVREKVWFGWGLAAMIGASVAKNFLITGSMETPDALAHALFIVLALSAIVTKNDVVNRVAAPFALFLISAYTGLLFTDLGNFG